MYRKGGVCHSGKIAEFTHEIFDLDIYGESFTGAYKSMLFQCGIFRRGNRDIIGFGIVFHIPVQKQHKAVLKTFGNRCRGDAVFRKYRTVFGITADEMNTTAVGYRIHDMRRIIQ